MPMKTLLYRLAGIVLALIAGLVVCVSLQQQILRWRAERLLADIHQIQMGKSTWADAQRLMYRWGAWGAWKGSCTAEQCDYQIGIQEGVPSHAVIFETDHEQQDPPWMPSQWLRSLSRQLGSRSPVVIGGFVVRKGIIWGKSFELILDVPRKSNPEGFEYILVADATAVSHFPSYYIPLEKTSQHPEYEIGTPGACEGCKSIYAHFTPFADPGFVKGVLDDFNLDCITRHHACIVEGDIMPATTRTMKMEPAINYNADLADSCLFPLELLGRDNRYVVTAEVVSNHVKGAGFGRNQLTIFRTSSQLKGEPILHSGETVEFDVQPFQIYGRDREIEKKVLKRGEAVILAFDRSINGEVVSRTSLSACGIIPFTAENLAAIQRGIQRDVLPPDTKPQAWP